MIYQTTLSSVLNALTSTFVVKIDFTPKKVGSNDTIDYPNIINCFFFFPQLEPRLYDEITIEKFYLVASQLTKSNKLSREIIFL
jgi:hypothetical protein